MKEEIYYGNLLGLLRMGRWNLSVKETEAMMAVVKETELRYQMVKGPVVKPVPEPIKKVEKKKGGNKS